MDEIDRRLLMMWLCDNEVARELGIPDHRIKGYLLNWYRPHRHYHNAQYHLRPLLIDIGKLGLSKENQDIMDLIAFFHDVVYWPQVGSCQSNESASAEIFLDCVGKDKRESRIAQIIYQSILDTEYNLNRKPYWELFHHFAFLDLHSFFINYTTEKEIKLMKEYQVFSYPEYRGKRMAFLEKMGWDRGIEIASGVARAIDHLSTYRPKIGVYAGSFNPFHIGHLNVLEQAENIFDKVIILKAINANKADTSKDVYPYPVENALPLHEVVRWDGLTTDFLKQVGDYADVTLVRGLRNGYDLQYEINLKRYMEDMSPDTDIVYFLSDIKYQHISSSDIRALSNMPASELAAKKYLVTKYDYIDKDQE